ncbi:MAG: DNA-3-methyladenine glycosylase family protein [Promethearchaeati archaeon]
MREIQAQGFSLQDTLECGQTFCWIKHDGGYINADVGQVVYVEQEGDSLFYETTDSDVPLERMLGLDHPIEQITSNLPADSILKESMQFANGLRIINDPFFPCLISFLCSIWKSIPCIRGLVEGIRKQYGSAYTFRGETTFGMPTPQQLAAAEVNALKDLGLAWRSEFIVKSTRSILEGDIIPNAILDMQYEEAHKTLKQLHGVGNKVADCVLLFSLGFLEAFPMDVWINRVIEEHYSIFTDDGASYAKKSKAARQYFCEYAGYAQQYLYYYSRGNSCRTSKKKSKRS